MKRHEDVWGAEIWIHAFLSLTLDGKERLSLNPGHFTPREKSQDTRWIGKMGYRAGMDAAARRRYPSPCRESNPSRSDYNVVTLLSELSRFPGNCMKRKAKLIDITLRNHTIIPFNTQLVHRQ